MMFIIDEKRIENEQLNIYLFACFDFGTCYMEYYIVLCPYCKRIRTCITPILTHGWW